MARAGRLAVAVVAALVAPVLAACGEGGDARSPSTTTSQTAVATAELETPTSLRRRLELERLAPGARCPRTAGGLRRVPRVAITLGVGPAYPVMGFEQAPPARNGVIRLATVGSRYRGRVGFKVLWAVGPDHEGPVLVRGARLDRPGTLLLQATEREPIADQLLLPDRDERWEYFPSTTYVAGLGCYGYQIDATDLQRVIVFEAVWR